jgi:hypothetical protein
MIYQWVQRFTLLLADAARFARHTRVTAGSIWAAQRLGPLLTE